MLFHRLAEVVPPDYVPPIVNTAAGASMTMAFLWANMYSALGYWPYWSGGLASVAALIYYVLTVLQMPIVQVYLKDRAVVKKAKRLAKLEAAQKITAAKIEALTTVKHAQAHADETMETAKAEAAKIIAGAVDANARSRQEN